MQGTDRKILPHLSIAFAIICWGGAYVAARYLLDPPNREDIALHPLVLAALRFLIASCFFVVPVGQAVIRRQISWHDLLLMGLIGQVTFSFYYWLQYLGIQLTNASIASLLGVGLIPLFTTLLALLFRIETVTRAIIGALLLGLAGVAIIALQQPVSFSFSSHFLFGMLCLVINTFSFALYSHISKRWMRTITPVVLTGGTMISGAIGLLLISLCIPTETHWNTIMHLHITQWLALLFLALACSVIAYVAYHSALKSMDATHVNTYFYIEPLITIVLAVVLLHELLTWQIIVGALLIGSSMVIAHRPRNTTSLRPLIREETRERV